MCRHRSRRSLGRGTAWLLPTFALALVFSGCWGVLQRHEAETEEDKTLPTVGTRKVNITTANGYIRVRPASEGDDSIKVHAIIRATASSEAEAQECLQAIEIATPVSGKDEATQEIGWAWREPRRQSSWQADVSFEVRMPPHLMLATTTSNGQIDVVGITGDCQIHTQNGAVRAVAATEKLQAESTNGAITIDSPADQVDISTTNGRIRGTLTNPSQLAGKIKAQNGSVDLQISKTAATDLECRTSNGRVRNKLPLEEVEKKGRNRLSGKLAGGGETLHVETQNGNIEIEEYAPPKKKSAQDRESEDRDD